MGDQRDRLLEFEKNLGIGPVAAAEKLKTQYNTYKVEEPHPNDRRRRIFRLADAYLDRGDADIQDLLEWCRMPRNGLA